MTHSISKPESERVEHSTYRMFKLDPFMRIGIDPRECLSRPGGSVRFPKPPLRSGWIRDPIQNQSAAKSVGRFLLLHFTSRKAAAKPTTNSSLCRSLCRSASKRSHYHFVEGYCRYWKGVEITDTTTKKIRSYDTAFSTKARAKQAFQKLFHHFRKSTLVISYSSNCIPSKSEMIELLKNEKSKVTVHESAHRYHHGNHAHKVGDNKNEVVEYLFIAE